MLAILLTLRSLAILTSIITLAASAVVPLPAPGEDQEQQENTQQDDAPPKGGGQSGSGSGSGSGGGGGGGIEIEAIITEPPPTFNTAEELLDGLEESIKSLENFSAILNYRKEDPFTSTEIRSGRILFHQAAPTNPEAAADAESPADGPLRKRFAITFERETIGQQMRERHQRYIFDGAWLVEIDFDNKQFIKRQVVPPGEVFDPLKLGEGPFPLPIGQPKEEVLARFTAELIDFPQDGFLRGRIPPSGIGVKLTPRAGLAIARDYESISIYYDRRTMLPVAVDALSPDGVRKIVVLFNTKKNEDLEPEEVEAMLSVEPPMDAADWSIDIRPWKDDR